MSYGTQPELGGATNTSQAKKNSNASKFDLR